VKKSPVWNFQDKLIRQIWHLKKIQDWQSQYDKLNQWTGSYDLIIKQMEMLAADVGSGIQRRDRTKSDTKSENKTLRGIITRKM
jgi:hypothetical protein